MTHWALYQWAIYYIIQWTIAACYFIIPWAIYERRKFLANLGIKKSIVGQTDSLLFRAFVLACGVHHLTHPTFMQLDYFWAMIAVDTATAGISTAAAIRWVRNVRIHR